jgi:hypothetical protein
MTPLRIGHSLFATVIALNMSCQKQSQDSKLNVDILKETGARRMDLYYRSLERWRDKPLVPTPNPVTPVRVLNDPFNKHKVVVVSFPEELTPGEKLRNVTEKWRDVYLLFPKNKSTNGPAFEVRSPEGPRSFLGDLNRKKYPSVDADFERKKFEEAHKSGKAFVILNPELSQFLDQQDKNSKAVLTDDVLRALYVSSQAFNNKDYSESVRQIMAVLRPQDINNKIDDYLVKIPYVGTSDNGPCKVILEVDGTGSVAGLSVAGEMQNQTKGATMLLGLLPLPLFKDSKEYCSIDINRFYNADGFYKTGTTKDSLEINSSSGDFSLTRESEWKDSQALELKSCQNIKTKIAVCGDTLTADFREVWMALSPVFPGIAEVKKNITCRDLRLSPEEIKIGKFVPLETKNKIIESGFFKKK